MVRDPELAPPLACHFFTHIRRTPGWKEIRRVTTGLPTAQTSDAFSLILMSFWHWLAQCVFIIWVQEAWSDRLRHIPLCLCHPTPAPHRLQTCHYSARWQFWCWRKFLAGAEFCYVVMTHNTQHSRDQTSLDNVNFEQFISGFTWLQQKLGTWFSEMFRHLLKGDFSFGIVIRISLHLLKPKFFQQLNLHVWKTSDSRFEEEGQHHFLLLWAEN